MGALADDGPAGPELADVAPLKMYSTSWHAKWEIIASLMSKIRDLRRYLRCFASVQCGLNLLTGQSYPEHKIQLVESIKSAGQRPYFTNINSVTIF